MTEYSDGYARPLEDILEDVSAGRLTVQEAAEWIRRQSPQMLHRPPRKSSRGIGFVICTVGVMFLGMAGLIGWQSYDLMVNGVKGQATVVEMVPRNRVLAPKYEYVVDDVTYSRTSEIGTNPPSYVVGDVVEIEYWADRPAEARIASWGERWTGTLAVGVLGGLVGGVGLVLLIFLRR